MNTVASNQMFHKAQNLQINGGQFINTTNGKVVEIRGSENGLDALYQRSAFGALLDSNERFDPPKCDSDTRIAILQTMIDWIMGGDEASSILWLHGSAGSGKSALAQSIAEKCRREEELAATFFFSRNALTSSRSDGNMLIATLAYQLTLTFPRTHPHIKKCIQKDLSIFDRTIDTQMENLITKPIKKIRRSFRYRLERVFSHPHHPRLIVIDGLDECSDPRIQCEILKVVGKATRELKLPYRFLVASRPESHICNIFDHDPILAGAGVTRIDLVNDLNTDNDIRIFLRSEFKKIVSTHPLQGHIPSLWPTEAEIEKLVCRSSGQFIYASTIIKYIQSPKHRPTDRLQIILGLSPTPANDTPYAALDALYTHIFLSVDDSRRVKQIFSVLVIPRTPEDGLGNFNTPEMIDKLLFLQPGDVKLILTDLLSIVGLGNNNSPIELHHASLSDFLLDPLRSGELFVDLGMAHEQLARGYMKLLQDTSFTRDGRRQPDLYLVPFLSHYEKAFLSDSLLNDLEDFNFIKIYENIASNDAHKIPSHISAKFNNADKPRLEAFWSIRNVWQSKRMVELFNLFTRKERRSNIEFLCEGLRRHGLLSFGRSNKGITGSATYPTSVPRLYISKV
ncbi:hypothetical protein BDZ97DRAFT_430369 [Flammula alnicola]|nr:hypothetical protein BDZ97DRAFT_430369 [Flammula alnicola]